MPVRRPLVYIQTDSVQASVTLATARRLQRRRWCGKTCRRSGSVHQRSPSLSSPQSSSMLPAALVWRPRVEVTDGRLDRFDLRSPLSSAVSTSVRILLALRLSPRARSRGSVIRVTVRCQLVRVSCAAAHHVVRADAPAEPGCHRGRRRSLVRRRPTDRALTAQAMP